MSKFYNFLEIFVKNSPAIWLWYRMLSEGELWVTLWSGLHSGHVRPRTVMCVHSTQPGHVRPQDSDVCGCTLKLMPVSVSGSSSVHDYIF